MLSPRASPIARESPEIIKSMVGRVLSIQDLSAGYRGLLSGRDEGFEYRT
jgi:hypothetical protein